MEPSEFSQAYVHFISTRSFTETAPNLREINSCLKDEIESSEGDYDYDYESSNKRLKQEILIIKDEDEDSLEENEFPSQENDLIEETVDNLQNRLNNPREPDKVSENNTVQLECDASEKKSEPEEQNLHIWDYFAKGDVLHKAVCVYCKADYTDCGSTTRLWRHLKEHHKEQIVEPKKKEYLNSYYEFILTRNASGADVGSKDTNIIYNHFDKIESLKANCVFCLEVCVVNNNDTNVLWNHLLNNHEVDVVLCVLENKRQYLKGYFHFINEISDNKNTSLCLKANNECSTDKYSEAKSRILMHYHRTSEESRDAVCIYCGKAYANRNTGTIWNHLLGHYKQKIGMFQDKKLLLSFILNLQEENNTIDSAVCVHCQTVFNLTVNTSSNLKSHLNSHPGPSSSNTQVRKPVRSGGPKYGRNVIWKHFTKLSKHVAICNYCKYEHNGKKHVDVTTLKRHLINKHMNIRSVQEFSDVKKSTNTNESESRIKSETVLLVEDSDS